MEQNKKLNEPGVLKVFTLKGSCKKCGDDFTYERVGDLRGTKRTVCNKCIATRTSTYVHRVGKNWEDVVGERVVDEQLQLNFNKEV